jgi:hypothetical protein
MQEQEVMCIQEKVSGTVYLYLSSQQGLVRLQLISHRWGCPTNLPAQYHHNRDPCISLPSKKIPWSKCYNYKKYMKLVGPPGLEPGTSDEVACSGLWVGPMPPPYWPPGSNT